MQPLTFGFRGESYMHYATRRLWSGEASTPLRLPHASAQALGHTWGCAWDLTMKELKRLRRERHCHDAKNARIPLTAHAHRAMES